MQKLFKILIIPFLALFLCTGTTFAYTIGDNYIGEEDHNWGDVIGSPDFFQIFEADLTISGTILTVDIQTNFAGQSGLLFNGLTYGGIGIAYGDLFLTSDWVEGIENTWDYVFSLDDRLNNSSGIGSLYQIGGAGTGTILNSEDFLSGGIYRNGQEVAYDAGTDDALASGTWNVVNSESISFVVDIAGTTLLYGDNIGIHWGMTCANDVIEGAAPVPEPATMLLLGTGLIGIAGVSRKKIFKK